MSETAPPLEKRSAAQIVEQIESRLREQDWPGGGRWQGGPGDLAAALAQLYGRLSELIVNRLNQTPAKHMLAYLDEAGIDLLPPQAASAELTFTPAKDAPPSIAVPAGTQVATKQTATQAEIVFETGQDLVVAPNRLLACLAFDPTFISDQTARAAGEEKGSFAAFEGDQERERILYLADDRVFTFADDIARQQAEIRVRLHWDRRGDSRDDGWQLRWQYFDGSEWQPFGDGDVQSADDGDSLTVSLRRLPQLMPAVLGGVEATWIACQLTGGRKRDHLPTLRGISAGRKIEYGASDLPIDAVYAVSANGTVYQMVDAGNEFFPLGQAPARLDAFYLRADAAFARPGSTVQLIFELEGIQGTPGRPEELNRLQVVWEYFSESGWTTLGASRYSGLDRGVLPILNFADLSNAFTKQGTATVGFRVPGPKDEAPAFAPTKVDNQAGYWLRARLAKGGYNEPGYVNEVKTGAETVRYDWVAPVNHAPLVRSLRLRCTASCQDVAAESVVPFCASRVDGMTRQHDFVLAAARGPGSATTGSGEATVTLDAGLSGASSGREISKYIWSLKEVGAPPGAAQTVASAFAPFSAPFEGPGLYLGFERAWPAERWIQILLEVEETAAERGDDVRATWEYWNGSRWQALRVSDGTQALAERGYLGFFAPSDHVASSEFGIEAYWLRLRPSAALLAAGPYLGRLRLNTVAAANAVSHSEEVIGSSDGKPHQTFRLLHSPILPGETLAVREPDRPPDAELARLQAQLQAEDENAQALLSEVRPGEGVWVRWRRVLDFSDSAPFDRHYTLDAISGEVRFGDGQQGKVPPIGANNVKAVRYRTHNGAAGNAGAGAINILRNPSGDLAHIKTVTNPEAAAAGSDAETVEEVRTRGPQALRHRYRAVTVEDFSWLAQEAGGELAQAWCLPARRGDGVSKEGWVTVVITPQSTAPKPTPRPALIRTVQAYLEDHALANLGAANHIVVKGPEYVEASVRAEVIPLHPEKADAVELAIVSRLNQFLHPLTGGPARAGWQLGRDLYLGEVFSEIEAVSGVDYVKSIRLGASIQQLRLRLQQPASAPFALAAGAQISTFDERKMLRLAMTQMPGASFDWVPVAGFKVGDQVNLVEADNTVYKERLQIAGIAGDTITFAQPFPPPDDWARAGAMRSADGRLRLPIAQTRFAGEEEATIIGLRLDGFGRGDRISIVADGLRHNDLEMLRLRAVETVEDRVFVPEGHLIFAGAHDIDMVLE